MFEYKNGDIVITNSNNRKKILNSFTENKKLINVKFLSLEEFKKLYYGAYNYKAIYYLMNKHNYKYDVAKTYLDNYHVNLKLKEELELNNLIDYDNNFKKTIKRIIIDGDFLIDPYLKKDLDLYETIYIKKETKNNVHKVYEFENIDDEVSFQAISILNALKNIDINNIYLVNVSSEYIEVIRRIFKIYNLPINLDKKNIYGLKNIQDFLSNLEETKDIKKSLEIIKDSKYYANILDICNRYVFTDTNDKIIDCIKNEIKNISIRDSKIKNAINVIDYNEINDDNAYYFIVGFNQGDMPKIHKDEDYISDKEKEKNLILTSKQKNKIEQEILINKIKNYANLVISYKLKTANQKYYQSSLISKLNMKIIKNKKLDYNNSNLYNKLELSKMLDRFLKYNEKDKNLNILYSNYKDIPYNSYDNSYTGISKEKIYNYLDSKLLLSYSSLDNYYKCGFRYYLNNILKLQPYEETCMTFIGNLFHYILSIAFLDGFDFDKEYDKYIVEKNFSYKEKFFINKLKDDLRFVIDTINKQNNYSSLKNELYEQKVFISKDKNIKITFMGVIDKVKYDYIDGKTIVAIIDYKTGNPDIKLDNIIYGLDMQLPIYLYLAKNLKLENITFGGFYLQKILSGKTQFDIGKDELNKKRENLRLEGYSNSNTDILSKIDRDFSDSLLIKSMKVSSKGFYSYAKVLDDKQIEKIIDITEKNIDEAINDIMQAKFNINPKKINFELKGCEYCPYSDICYRKEKNIVELKEIKKEEFLGSDMYA